MELINIMNITFYPEYIFEDKMSQMVVYKGELSSELDLSYYMFITFMMIVMTLLLFSYDKEVEEIEEIEEEVVEKGEVEDGDFIIYDDEEIEEVEQGEFTAYPSKYPEGIEFGVYRLDGMKCKCWRINSTIVRERITSFSERTKGLMTDGQREWYSNR